MPIEQWKNVYFPEGDAGVQKASKDATSATLHSLNKWRGLSPEVLSDHNLSRRKEFLLQAGMVVFAAGEDECALCVFDTNHFDGGNCLACPLQKTIGLTCSEYTSPYQHWINTGDNNPMVDALEKTVEFLDKGGV